MMMHIWVDADACPRPIKDILFRAAQRTGLPLTLVANQPVSIPRATNIHALQVESGFDVADAEIVRRSQAGDLVITADIPLAAEVIDKGCTALNPRGELYKGNHRCTAEHARFYGYPARQRDPDRRTTGTQSG